MITDDEPITLITLGNGAAVEKFQDELQKVLDNIMDPNTKPDEVREVTLKVKIKPDEKRSIGSIFIEAKSKLVADSAFKTMCSFGSAHGKGIAREYKQTLPLFDEKGDGKVVEMNGKKKGE